MTDLSVNPVASNPNPIEGEQIVISIAYSNIGNVATGVTVTSVVPSTFTVVGTSGAPYNPGSGTWTLGTLINGQGGNLNLTIKPHNGTAGNTYTIPISITAASPTDSNLSNNSQTITITVH
jgi:hypothetical protein